MKANKSVISALLSVALLAVPITAAAHPRDDGHNRGPAPAYHQAPAYRPVVAPRANYAPRVAANNQLWMTPTSPIVPVRDHDDWRWRDRDDGWKHQDRDDWRGRDQDRDDGSRYRREHDNYRTVCDRDGDDCRQVPRTNNLYYREGYQPNYYPRESYNYAPQSYGAPVGGGLANLIRERDNAQILYQQAVRNGNRVRAKHLRNDIVELNKRIASGEHRTGYNSYNPASYNSYAPSGYGTPDAFTSMMAPLIGNYIH